MCELLQFTQIKYIHIYMIYIYTYKSYIYILAGTIIFPLRVREKISAFRFVGHSIYEDGTHPYMCVYMYIPWESKNALKVFAEGRPLFR